MNQEREKRQTRNGRDGENEGEGELEFFSTSGFLGVGRTKPPFQLPTPPTPQLPPPLPLQRFLPPHFRRAIFTRKPNPKPNPNPKPEV